MVTIAYTIKGTCQVDESVYSDAFIDERPQTLDGTAINEDTKWSDLTDNQKVEFIKLVESESGYEAVAENTIASDTKLTSVTL